MIKSKSKKKIADATTKIPTKKKTVKTKTTPQLKINLQIIYKAEYIPKMAQFKTWVKFALLGRRKEPTEINIRIVDTKESSELNEQYRHKNGATNILSFPLEIANNKLALPLLGDLVICAPLVLEEALTQKKTIEAHWAHLTIHGVLHLLGHNHETEEDAQTMEDLEIELMEKLGLDNPYT